jgi:sulfopyruvate decarboxylase subunit alpha
LKEEVEDHIISILKEQGIDFVVTLPEDPSARLTSKISKDPYFTYIRVVNEGHGVGITAGAGLAGRKAIFVTGIAGLMVSTWQIVETGLYARIPYILLISYRGDIGDESVAGTQLYIFKQIAEPLLRTIQVPYRIINEPSKLRSAFIDALGSAKRNKTPVVLLLTEEALW